MYRQPILVSSQNYLSNWNWEIILPISVKVSITNLHLNFLCSNPDHCLAEWLWGKVGSLYPHSPNSIFIIRLTAIIFFTRKVLAWLLYWSFHQSLRVNNLLYISKGCMLFESSIVCFDFLFLHKHRRSYLNDLTCSQNFTILIFLITFFFFFYLQVYLGPPGQSVSIVSRIRTTQTVSPYVSSGVSRWSCLVTRLMRFDTESVSVTSMMNVLLGPP